LVRVVRALPLGLALVLPGFVAAQPAEEVVSLPPLMVEGKTKPLPWRYLAVPGMELLSVCDDSVSLDVVRRMHRLEELLALLLPERFRAKVTVPEAQILFNEEVGRANSQEIIDEMMKRSGGRPLAEAAVPLPGGRSNALPRVRFLPNMRLWDLDTSAVFSILQSSTATSFTFASDRIAFLLERRAPALPDWFVEGTLGLYARAQLRTDDIHIEPATWTSEEETRALARDPEWPRTLLPMQEFLMHPRPRTPENDREVDRVWRAQCALFVRWAVVEKKGARREALWKFVDRLETEPLTEALFREHFAKGFADMRDELSDYLPVAVTKDVTLEGPKTKALPRLRFRPATDLEVARLRGRWERMQIAYVRRRYPALAQRYVDQARRTLQRVYDRGERDPMLVAELGLTELDAGNPDAARELLEAAARAGVVRPRASFELARLRYKSVAGMDTPDAKLTAFQVEQAVAPLLNALTAQPPLLEIHALLGDIWLRSPTPLTSAELAVIEDGARLFPNVPALVIRAAHVLAVNGQVDRALALTDLGQRHARDPALRQRFELMRRELIAAKK
jgi:hypothetical protein